MSWGPEPIGTEIRRELARFGAAGAMDQIVAAWPAAVGEAIAHNAWPARVGRDGTLHVAASSSAWAFELTQLAPTILERLAAALEGNAPAALRFAPGPLPEPGSPTVKDPTRVVPEPSRSQLREADRIAAPIADPELRALVTRAAAASLAAPEQGPADRAV